MGQARTAPRNLTAYWRMELANVFFVPGLALALGYPRDAIEGIAIGLASVATAGFLVVGTMFWRGVDRRLRVGDRAFAARALDFADTVEKPLLAVTVGAFAATLAALAVNGWSRAVIAAALLTVLAALEYVNYYHRQLQHFDNRADFMRLLTGRGGKPSHMARDLAAWRRARLARSLVPD